jgi:hypothetical protein
LFHVPFLLFRLFRSKRTNKNGPTQDRDALFTMNSSAS